MKQNIMMSIDLEWFFHDDVKLFDKMNLYERKVYNGNCIDKAIEIILDICSKNGSKLTFFVLGEIYDAYPEILYEIKRRGHEIAYHTHRHKIIRNKDDLEQELRMSKSFVDQFSPKGFRAPNINMSRDCLKILEDHGFEYDSSIYGTKKFVLDNIVIVPVSVCPYFNKIYTEYPNPLTFSLISRSVPFGSGLFLGLMKDNIIYYIDKYIDTYEEPPVIFVHSWQIVQKKMPLKFKLKKPFMIPYSTELGKTFDNITSKFDVIKIYDHIKDKT